MTDSADPDSAPRENAWEIIEGTGPLVAAAIHDGHAVRGELTERLALAPLDRLREEDPVTSDWTLIAPTRIVGLRSRFEVDLNRPRAKAVYLTPADAWGLQVWREPLPADVLDRSLEVYDQFYAAVGELLTRKVQAEGRVVVFDLHTYNHRRAGSTAPPDDEARNPQVNLGTGTMDRQRWAPLVDRFLHDLRHFDYPVGQLDVRENVKFTGGHFGRWIHQQFPDSVCVLSIEFKKFFMDEWTGQVHQEIVERLRAALCSTLPGVQEELARL